MGKLPWSLNLLYSYFAEKSETESESEDDEATREEIVSFQPNTDPNTDSSNCKSTNQTCSQSVAQSDDVQAPATAGTSTVADSSHGHTIVESTTDAATLSTAAAKESSTVRSEEENN